MCVRLKKPVYDAMITVLSNAKAVALCARCNVRNFSNRVISCIQRNKTLHAVLTGWFRPVRESIIADKCKRNRFEALANCCCYTADT